MEVHVEKNQVKSSRTLTLIIKIKWWRWRIGSWGHMAFNQGFKEHTWWQELSKKRWKLTRSLWKVSLKGNPTMAFSLWVSSLPLLPLCFSFFLVHLSLLFSSSFSLIFEFGLWVFYAFFCVIEWIFVLLLI